MIKCIWLRYNRSSVGADCAARDLYAGAARADHRVGRARVGRRRAARGVQDRRARRAPADVDGGRQGQVGRPEAQSAGPRGKETKHAQLIQIHGV